MPESEAPPQMPSAPTEKNPQAVQKKPFLTALFDQLRGKKEKIPPPQTTVNVTVNPQATPPQPEQTPQTQAPQPPKI